VLSITVGVSALAHATAIAALLALKPAPLSAPTRETIEVLLVQEPVAGSRHPDEEPAAVSQGRPADVSATGLPWPIRPDAGATAPPPNWPGNADHVFDLPARPTFKLDAQSLVIATLGTMLDCPVVEGSARAESGRPRHARAPCVPADLPLRVAVPMLPTNASESGGSEVRADDDYRTFKANPWAFNEGLFLELHAKF
jgi:hypothetical protein